MVEYEWRARLTDADWRQHSSTVTVAAESGAAPIFVVPGDQPPTKSGQAGGYRTKSGKLIAKPSAYKRAGGRCEYVRSSERITVGEGWLVANGLPLKSDCLLDAETLPKLSREDAERRLRKMTTPAVLALVKTLQAKGWYGWATNKEDGIKDLLRKTHPAKGVG